MADTKTSQTIQDGGKTAVLKFTNESDGTGEASVTGDIDFTTVGHSSGDAYSIILVLNKNF